MTTGADATRAGAGSAGRSAEATKSPPGVERFLPPSACSRMWDRSESAVWGTAAVAGFFVALEQAGPWGRIAFTQSRLDPAVGTALEQRCAAAGGRALLIRPSGRRAASPDRQLYVSGGMPQGRPWLLGGHLDRPEDVLALPFEAIADGDLDRVQAALPALRRLDESVLLVCAHSRRDVCCAVRGRPIAADADRTNPGRAWECSHTGGHRFAPTAVMLPSGATLARLDPGLAGAAMNAPLEELPHELAGPRHLRGLSHLPLIAQAADGYVRERSGTLDVTALQIESTRESSDGVHVRVRHRDGRTWLLLVTAEPDSEARTNSCGTSAIPTNSFAVCELR